MNLRFAVVVIVVLFVGAPSLESIGARAQSACSRACSAVRRTDPGTLRGIINEGASLCNCVCPGANGGGPLHVAVRSRCGLCIEYLTSSPSNCPCEDRDSAGNTPLHDAARLCRGPSTDRLLQAGCSIFATDNDGNTPLCEVARTRSGGECGQVARTLVSNGGPACTLCGDGQTPCGGCVQQGVCDVLEQDGACNCPL